MDAEIPLSPATTTNIPSFPPSGGMYRAHDLERHVKTYTLTDSDMDLLESGGLLFDSCLAVSSFFGSVTVTGFLAGATLPSQNWTAQQWALFYYCPRACLVITIVVAGLVIITGIRRSKARKRIRKESFAPGTYVPER